MSVLWLTIHDFIIIIPAIKVSSKIEGISGSSLYMFTCSFLYFFNLSVLRLATRTFLYAFLTQEQLVNLLNRKTLKVRSWMVYCGLK